MKKSNIENLEIEELVKEYYRTGDESIKSLVINKFHIIVKNCCAKLYLLYGDTDDLIQEGNIGLLKAFNTYDPEKNDKFIPFAIMCIKGAQINAVKKEMKDKIKNEKKDEYIPRVVSLDHEVESGSEEILHAKTLSPENIVIGNVGAVEIFNQIEKSLSKNENEVLLYLAEGLKQREIAEILGEDTKKIDNTIYRIRTKGLKIINKNE